MFVNDLKLEVIATYETNEQEFFICGVWESAIKSEKKLIKYIKEQLNHKDLIKLSLCWICSKNVFYKNFLFVVFGKAQLNQKKNLLNT